MCWMDMDEQDMDKLVPEFQGDMEDWALTHERYLKIAGLQWKRK